MEGYFVPYKLEVKLKELGCKLSFKTVVSEQHFYVDIKGDKTSEIYFKDRITEGMLWQQAFKFVCRLISEAELDPEGELSVTFEDGNFCLERVIWMEYEGFCIEPLTQSSEESLMFLINILENKR